MRKRLFYALALLGCVLGAAAQTAAPPAASAPPAGGYSAGLQPDRRPDGAPPPNEAVRTPAQTEQALHGIVKPVPGNVESIAATGNWFVPLRQPGLNPPYDLRGLHGAATGVTEPAGAPSTGASAAR